MPQYDKRFMLNVNVVYRMQIVDKDSQDLRTSSRSGKKFSYNVKVLFTAVIGQDSHGPRLFEDKKVAGSDPVWRIFTCSPALTSFCDTWCTERLRWSAADLSPRRPKCRSQASSSWIWGGQCVNGAGLSPCTSAFHPTTPPSSIVHLPRITLGNKSAVN